MRYRGLLVGFVAWLAVAGCGDGEPESYPWPEVHGYERFEGASTESVIDALIGGAYGAFGDDYEIDATAIYAVGTAELRDGLAAEYGALLRDWQVIDSTGSTGRTWERGDQRFTLVFVTVDDQRLAVTLATRRR